MRSRGTRRAPPALVGRARALVGPALVGRAVLTLVLATIVVVDIGGFAPATAGPVDASPAPATPAGATAGTCDCNRFDDELAAARALFASRGEGATIRLQRAARDRFRERVLGTYARATCLVDCTGAPEPRRDDARAVLAAAAFKARGLGPTDDEAHRRLDRARDETQRCLAHAGGPPACHLFNASIRGIQARGSWNPMQLGLPKQLRADFRAARAGAAPGNDPPDGAATRAEATLLLEAPKIAGGDPAAARQLMEEARRSPLYACTVDNRLLYAEIAARTGTPEQAIAELRAALTVGLPSCGDNRYENATDLEEAARCLQRLESHPGADPGWANDCR